MNTSSSSNSNECPSNRSYPDRNGSIPLTLLLQSVPFVRDEELDEEEDAMSVCSDISQDDSDFVYHPQQVALPHLARRRNSSSTRNNSMRDSRWAADETTTGTASSTYASRFSFPRQDSIPRRYTRTTSAESSDSSRPLGLRRLRHNSRPAEVCGTGRDLPFSAPIRTHSGHGSLSRAPRRVSTDSEVEDTIQRTIDILDEAIQICEGL